MKGRQPNACDYASGWSRAKARDRGSKARTSLPEAVQQLLGDKDGTGMLTKDERVEAGGLAELAIL